MVLPEMVATKPDWPAGRARFVVLQCEMGTPWAAGSSRTNRRPWCKSNDANPENRGTFRLSPVYRAVTRNCPVLASTKIE